MQAQLGCEAGVSLAPAPQAVHTFPATAPLCRKRRDGQGVSRTSPTAAVLDVSLKRGWAEVAGGRWCGPGQGCCVESPAWAAGCGPGSLVGMGSAERLSAPEPPLCEEGFVGRDPLV